MHKAGDDGDPGTVTLELEPVSENAAVARQAVDRLVDRCGLDRAAAAARIVVTEAFTNAARHAYPNGYRAPITVSARKRGEALEISVRDRGRGIRPRPVDAGAGGRLGLLMIAAVADCVQIARVPSGGTELRARVSAASALAAEA